MSIPKLTELLKTLCEQLDSGDAESASIALINAATEEIGVIVLIARGEAAQDYLNAYQAVNARREADGGTLQ